MEHRQEWHRAAHPLSQGNQSESLTSSHPTDKRKSFTKREETETQPHDPASKSRSIICTFLHLLLYGHFALIIFYE